MSTDNLPATPPPATPPPAADPTAQPAAPEAAAAPDASPSDDGGAPPKPRYVSWDEHSNVRHRLRQEAERARNLERQFLEIKGRYESIEGERGRERETYEGYKSVYDFIRSHPELYRLTLEALDGTGLKLPPQLGQPPQPGGAGKPGHAELNPEVTGKLDKVLGFFETLQAERQEQQEQAEVNQKMQRLRSLVTHLVKERGLAKTPQMEDLWVRRAMPGVIRYAQQYLQSGGEESDLPWLLERFVADELTFVKALNDDRVAGHQANAAVVAPVPSGAPVVSAPAEKKFALGTPEFRQAAKDILRQRLQAAGVTG